jgi:sugar/nucleoside kinase (ribokinase family)
MARREKAIIALGNALTDIIVDVKEEDLIKLGLKKGCVNYPQNISLKNIPKNKKMVPGGSPANVVVGASYLGLQNRNGFIGTVGDDEIGKLYQKDLSFNRVLSYLTEVKGNSGISYMFITPDGDRTSIVDLGVCANFQIPLEEMGKFSIFHTSVYELATNQAKTISAINNAYSNHLKISFDLADPNLVNRNKNLIREILKFTDILFANSYESKSLTGLEPEDSVEKLNEMCEVVAVKMGERGSLVKKSNGPVYRIPCYPANVVDTTGAGDAYAAGFLYGYFQEFELQECGHLGSFFAARICERYGARMRYLL